MNLRNGGIGAAIGLTLLGIASLVYTNVFMQAGDYEEVFIAYKGLDRISPTHHQQKLSFNQCDNYILGSKNEENPNFTTLSVRPGITAYLNNTGSPVRGMFHYTSPGGDDVILMATRNTIYKSTGSSWLSLLANLGDSPWEGNLYSDPDVSRLYLCNGLDANYKYLPGQSYLMRMQNQDDETQISGNVWLTLNSSSATVDATALASLEVGRYIKTSTTADDLKWLEITSIEGTTLKFSTTCTSITSQYAFVVRSNYIDNSRYILEYGGRMITGYISRDATTSITSTASTDVYSTGMAYGVAQSFTAASNNFSKIRMRIYQFDKTDGNIVIKVKESLTSSTYLAQIVYPISSLPVWSGTHQETTFDFGNTAIVSGTTYYFTIERENSSAGYFQIFLGDYAGGNAYWTYNSTGFDGSWNTGQTTIEVSPLSDSGDRLYPTGNFGSPSNSYLDQANPLVEYWSFNPITLITSTYAGWFSGQQRKSYHHFYSEYGCVSTEANNWDNVKFSIYKTSATTGEVKVYRKLTSAYAPWSFDGGAWTKAGCSSLEVDFTATNAVSNTNTSTLEGWITFEVTSIARIWTPALGNNYGILLSAETTAGHTFYADGSASAVRPKWTLTTATGKTAGDNDIWFEVLTDKTLTSTWTYSKKYLPENFPVLNTFKIPGRIVGLAKSGGYLIVAGKNPDALHFYRETGDTRDGYGIDGPIYTATNLTIGSSKSIAYLPKDEGFLFYSGMAVYHCLGTQVNLISGQIRDEAKKFSNYRDPRDYYGGMASLMPQGVVLPTKDVYLLSTPNTAVKNSYIYVYNYADGSWCRWTGLYATSLLTRAIGGSGGAEPRLYLGFDTGQVYTLDLSGSTTEEAVLEYYLGGPDITKEKILNYLELWGRADNPYAGGYITLEVSGVDRPQYISTTTLPMLSNATTDKMIKINCSPAVNSREFKIRLTQEATQGAVSWRSLRFKYKVMQ